MADMLTPCWIAGGREVSGAPHPVHDKFTGERIAAVALADAGAVVRALDAACACHERGSLSSMASHARARALGRVAGAVEEDAEGFARLLVAEVGKTIREARVEVARSVETLRLSAEEATRITGEFLPLDGSARAARAGAVEAVVRRAPVGVCAMISPFNFPLNLAAHKIGPAIAAGCPFVLKPSPRAPLAALRLGEALAGAGLPEGSWSILLCEDAAADLMVTHAGVRMLSFTGSPGVGWAMRARAGKKKVVLELGGVGCCIVDAGADVARAAERIAAGGYSTAGQSCISVQRVLAHRSLLPGLREELVRRVGALRVGDPREEATDVGPLISEAEAARVEAWIGEAERGGGRLLVGGSRRGALLMPAVVESPPPESRLACAEVFGPVVALEGIDRFEEAVAAVNAMPFGLQAGVFTGSLSRALAAWRALEVGGVVINDVPTTRYDAMPYGGIKESGLGREGVAASVAEYTEPRVLLVMG